MPKIAIRYVDTLQQMVTVNGAERTFVKVAIECVDQDMYATMTRIVKRGSEFQEATLTILTTVAVPNPNLFRQFLTFKYWETKGLWKSALDDNSPRITETSCENRLKRIRAEIKEKMFSQPELYTIDLTEKRKHKRAREEEAEEK